MAIIRAIWGQGNSNFKTDNDKLYIMSLHKGFEVNLYYQYCVFPNSKFR